MILNIGTSIETERKIKELQGSLRLSTKAAIIRIAIGIAFKDRLVSIEEIGVAEFHTDGASYNPLTIMNDHSTLYEDLLTTYANRNLSDEESTKLLNLLIDEGVSLLHSKYQYFSNYEKMIEYLISGEF